jgi:hypothetical protein
VALDGLIVPRWISLVLSELRGAAFADFALVIIVRLPVRRGWRRERLRGLLFSLYEFVDYRAFRSSPDAFELVDETSNLRPELPLLTVASDSLDPFAESDLEIVRSHDPDVVLWFAETAPRGEILRCPRRGVWRLHHGDPALYRDGPPFFWELFDRQTVSATVLEDCADNRDGQPRLIYSSRSAIHPQSLYQSRNSPYWKAAQFMLRCLRQLAAEGEVALEWPSAHRPVSTDKTEPRGIPSNLQMLPFLIGLFARGTRSRFRGTLFREHWFLGYRIKKDLESASEHRRYAVDMQGFTIVSPSRGRSAADPFMLYKDGRHHVFFEDFSTQDERGVISRIEILPDGSITDPERVLERDYHLSYPFVFVTGDAIYMLPETASNRAIELYRAEVFPTKWRYERTLISNVTAVDPTIVEQASKLWLFANVKEYGTPYSDELCIYFAESLDGPWTPHLRNPVVSDVQSARPAGRIFKHGTALIRPGQDSSGRYGRAVILNRIDVLTERDYRETPVGRIDSSWRSGNLGTHTYNFDDLYEVVDGREWEPRWEDLWIRRRRRRLAAIRQNDT